MSNTNKCKTENTVREKVQGGITLDWRLRFQGKCNRTMGQVLRTLPKERFMRCPEVEKNGNKDRVKFRKKEAIGAFVE